MQQTDRILAQFESQALACEQMGSPFTARLCRILASRLDGRTRFGRAILEWAGDPFTDNIALRACGALHALARSGWEPNVTAVYPPATASDHAIWIAIADALAHNDVFLTDRLKSAPQTNEVARSATILGGMLHIASLTRQPLELLEFGASAGLNLGFDTYRYELGEGRFWGNPKAALTISNEWRGGTPPLDAPISVVSRSGCDLAPVDPARPADRERLLSYVWADQTERLQRLTTALDLAAERGPKIEQADAAEWVERKLAEPQPGGTTRVLFHTVVWQYLPATTQARITSAIAKAGETATRTRPLALLAFDGDDTPGSGRLDMSLWPGRTVTLGRAHFHGRWTEWR